jgi:hypothetical protein
MAAPLNYTGQTREEDLLTLGSALYFAAGLSLVAALIHLWVMPEHFEEWWGYGTFFLVVSVAQAVYVALLLGRPAVSFFVLGIGGNLVIIVLWLTTRTVGIPFFGPHAWEVEKFGVLDVSCTVAELILVITLALLLRRLRPVGVAV